MRYLKWIGLALLLLACAQAALSEGTRDPQLPVASNGRLSLFLSEDLCRVDITDQLTGRTWSSSMNDETAAGMKIIPAQQRKVNSLLAINCTNLATGLGVVNNLPLLGEKALEAQWEAIPDGVRLSYYYGTYQVGVQVELTLTEDSLVVSVPYAGIREDGQFSLVSVDALPYLFSATDLADGYFLYPDGCGAVMVFQDNCHYREPSRLYPIYGDYTKQPALLDMFAQESPEVLMPVFGMNRGGRGLLAVIEEGAETARVSLNCSNNIIALNYLFANFQYRRSFDDRRVTSRDIKVFDKEDIRTDYRMRILFMEEEDPDYSAMACAWRDYLLESGRVKRADREAAVAVDLFMSAPEEGLLFDTPRTVTTLKQAETILTALADAGVTGIRASLKGWSSDGYGKTPDHFPMSGAIGGDGGFSSLRDTARRLGARLTLTADFVLARADQGGYSHRNDVIYTGNHAILTDAEETVFLLSPDVTQAKYNDFLRRAAALGVDGVRLERVGQYVPANYYQRRYTTAERTVDIYRTMTAAARDTLGLSEAEGGNACLLGTVDLVTRVPYEDFGYQATTAAVPFYQIALHGLVTYTGTPGNLSSDLEREVLRWVEMGYAPYFELTHDNTEELMYTNYQTLFSAEYGAWLDRVAAAAKQFTGTGLAALAGRLITRHERLGDQLVRVTYEDGTRVYVNYGAADAEDGGLIIPGASWRLVGPDGEEGAE